MNIIKLFQGATLTKMERWDSHVSFLVNLSMKDGVGGGVIILKNLKILSTYLVYFDIHASYQISNLSKQSKNNLI